MSEKKREHRSIISFIGIVMSLLCLCGCGQKSDVREQIVYIETVIPHARSFQEPIVRGTGFFVGKGGTVPDIVVTSAHTAGLPDDGEKAEIRVYTDGEEYITAEIVASDTVNNVAVLRLSSPAVGREPLVICIPGDAAAGSEVVIAGYPVSSGTSEDMGKTGVSVRDEKIVRVYTEAGSNVQHFLLSGDTAADMPGAPVINENGSVVGICCGYGADRKLPDPESAKYAESIEVVKNMLDMKLIANETEASFPWLTVVLIAVAAIIAIFIILVVIRVIARRKNPPKIQTNGQGPIPTSSADPSGDSGYRIECTAGALAGKRIMIKTSGAIVIGSKAGMCSVAIPGDPAGVGSRHCEIWFNGTEVCIRDAGSPYGTVLASGKLSANETAVLKEGDVFTIGTDEQKFVIKKKKNS